MLVTITNQTSTIISFHKRGIFRRNAPMVVQRREAGMDKIEEQKNQKPALDQTVIGRSNPKRGFMNNIQFVTWRLKSNSETENY